MRVIRGCSSFVNVGAGMRGLFGVFCLFLDVEGYNWKVSKAVPSVRWDAYSVTCSGMEPQLMDAAKYPAASASRNIASILTVNQSKSRRLSRETSIIISVSEFIMCAPWLPRIGYFKDYIKATKRPPSVICIQSIFGYLSPLVLFEPPISHVLHSLWDFFTRLSGTPCTRPVSHSFFV